MLLSDKGRQAISLRSPEGLRALDSMITLCKATSKIRAPVGLETCHCLKSDKGWDHVYSCSLAHLRHQYGSAGYCFFCPRWYTGDGWSDHCEEHLSDRNFRSPESRDPRSSLLCNPIKLEGVLVTPGVHDFAHSAFPMAAWNHIGGFDSFAMRKFGAVISSSTAPSLLGLLRQFHVPILHAHQQLPIPRTASAI